MKIPLFLLLSLTPTALLAGEVGRESPTLIGVPVDFILFAATLLGVALFHHRTLQVALSGLGAILAYKWVFTGFRHGEGLPGLLQHFGHEWVILLNLFCLLLGFALLADHFERSHLPERIPHLLPKGWHGGFTLLCAIFVLSAFLDNIAAAIIGGAAALTVYQRRVHIGYLAAIVAASNAGGAGSVVGDTTTTMMWIAGVSPIHVLPAFVAATTALVVFGIPASLQQEKYAPLASVSESPKPIDRTRLGIVLFILVAAVATNVTVNLAFASAADHFPFIGVAVWVALLLASPLRQPDWSLMPATIKGSLFLLALVTCASLMPVEKLPPASWVSSLILGFISAVFDNIPLTALAIKQGGYDWGLLAFAVGFGGSMIWFGSSAGVAISNLVPEAKSVGLWLRNGWHIPLAYLVGFAVMFLLLGWNPTPIGR
ncbi:MAG: citrate transporter [Magnetococcales bacterium]|nr:citrate transporter [Magnetococcales bacterium]